MLLKVGCGLSWLEFEILQKYSYIKHGVLVGSSDFYKGVDSKEKIKELFSLRDVAFGVQKHEDQLIKIDLYDQVIKESSDALFTEKKELALGIFHADCQAALFFDPIKKVIANVHCGWRGNVLNILGKTVQTLKDTFKSDPKQLIVCISPSLGPDRSEFIHYLNELPVSFYPFMHKKNYFDLWKISESQLLKAGVEKNNIEIARMCTFENNQMFHSYRRDKSAKRNLTFIAITSHEQ